MPPSHSSSSSRSLRRWCTRCSEQKSFFASLFCQYWRNSWKGNCSTPTSGAFIEHFLEFHPVSKTFSPLSCSFGKAHFRLNHARLSAGTVCIHIAHHLV